MHIYFDNNATVQTSQNVVASMIEILNRPLNASSIHESGRRARQIVENAREKLKHAFNIPEKYRVIFTSSATEANNTVIKSAGVAEYKVYASAIEHPSVMQMKPDVLLPVKRNGEICLNELDRFCKDADTSKVVLSVMLANNETGVIQPILAVREIAKKYGILCHVDAAQAPGKVALNIEELDADVVTISGHKFGGPQGIGCIIYNANTFEVTPLIRGGGQEYGLRSGTENIAAIKGLGVACDEVRNRVAIMHERVEHIRNFIEKEILNACPDAIIFGKNAKNRLPNTSSITMPGVKSEVQVAYFDANGFAVSAGSACSAGRVEHPHVQMAMGYSYDESSCALRVSLGINNTMDEAELFVKKWIELYEKSIRNK